ncbi:hypothetical protein MKEN_01388200 [Mycena kentingensis (nom. inval.)]|nr:hypothetical protein MKEN_01388200 [Mycena kentingensis (nom. inval.)]
MLPKMPSLEDAKTLNSSFNPAYTPVAVFIGGTSGVGEAMAEAFARYTQRKAHIILVGRNEYAAKDIIARFPKPEEGLGGKYESIACDVRLMANVRAACAEIRAKVDGRVNFLVLTAGYSSMVNVGLTEEGLDLRLAMRYYQRYVFIRELLPLMRSAKALGQDAHAMSVLGAGLGTPKRALDLDNLGNTIKPRDGRVSVAMRSMVMSSGYTDAMLAPAQHFASQNPDIAFTHIHPGIVNTAGMRASVDLDGVLAPLAWLINCILPWLAVHPSICAEHMLSALLPSPKTSASGLFIRTKAGDICSAHTFKERIDLGDNNETASLIYLYKCRLTFKQCMLNGVAMKGYGASDLGVKRVLEHSERATGY